MVDRTGPIPFTRSYISPSYIMAMSQWPGGGRFVSQPNESSRVADPQNFIADPDPTFHFKAEPDPAFHSNTDPDPASKNNADPDPHS
jgi:hypothetical protein